MSMSWGIKFPISDVLKMQPNKNKQKKIEICHRTSPILR